MTVKETIKILTEIVNKYNQYGVEYFDILDYSDVIREYDNENNIKYDIETDDYKIDLSGRTIYLL